MLPGKKYTTEDFLWMAWARKWFIIIPALIIGAATAAWSYTLPDRYSSTATILVVPQMVPHDLVPSAVTTSVSQRLQTIGQQIMTRTRLERIIEEFNLYRDERETMLLEDIVENMRRRDIRIDPVQATAGRRADATHFTVRFQSDSPRTAMQVTERLAFMFVQENLQDRALLADSTNQFLQAQLEDARRRLIDHEAKLQTFKQRYAGQLPEQAQSNLQMMQMTQTQIQSNVDGATRDRDRLAAVETAMADLIATSAQPRPAEGKTVEGPVTAAQQLEAARVQLSALEQRLKPNHPDIARAKRIIADLELKADEETAQQTTLGGAETGTSLPPAVAARFNSLRTEADALRRSLETRKAEDGRLRGVLASYSNKLETTPKLESELTELMRDYTTIQEQYTSLLKKTEETKIAVNLERRQIGEQFRIIDGARLPERPVSPDRFRLNLMGLLGGLAFGIGLVALLEYKDTTLKTDDDIVTSLALPVWAVIPRMLSATDRQRLKRRRLILGFSAASVTTALVIVAVAMWRFNLLAMVR